MFKELADLKCMSVCKSNYPPIRFRHGIRHDAAKVRQNKVWRQHRRNPAHTIDINHCGWDPATSTMGPCQTKLVSYGRTKGLVVGGYAEGSPDLHALINKMVETGAVKHLQTLDCSTLR